MISFPVQPPLQVLNHVTGRSYYLNRCDSISPSADRVAEVVAICNEAAVYEWLFRERFMGVPYSPENAIEWFSGAAAGWRNQTHFCFAVTDADGKIVAACDVKSSKQEGAEIGYWCSAHEGGIITNAVVAMCGLAKKAGFRSLMAAACHGNLRSRAVLKRVGFQVDPSRRNAERDYFNLSLSDLIE